MEEKIISKAYARLTVIVLAALTLIVLLGAGLGKWLATIYINH